MNLSNHGRVLSPQDVHYFQTIARRLSLRTAAADLHVTQPCLSHALKRLEEAVGESLFERTPKGLKLTSAGQRLYQISEPALRSWSALTQEMDSLKEFPRQRLRLGIHVSVASYFAAPLLKNLSSDSNWCGFELVHGLSRDLTRLVLDGELEVAVAMNPAAHPSLVIRELLKDSVRVFASPQLKTFDHIIYDPALAQAQWLLRAHERAGQTFAIHSHSGSLEVIRALAADVVGAAILPSRVAAQAASELIPIKPKGPAYKDRLCLVCRPLFAQSSTLGKRLISVARATATQLDESRLERVDDLFKNGMPPEAHLMIRDEWL